ncbi:hypothetical protein BDZ89DRAFT_269182 [Hymenopellis radicata]|nr:hypothetical protein BDZ89DRAFT_269182 [Hymenopellis radicata]
MSDKNWLLWVSREPGLPSPIPVFLTAVDYYLDNPRHYEHTRDIGRKTSHAGRAVNDKEPNTDDEAFIDEVSDSEIRVSSPAGRPAGRKPAATHRDLGYTYRSGTRRVAYLSSDVSDSEPKRVTKHRRPASSSTRRIRNQFVHRPDEAERSDSTSRASFVVSDSKSLIYDTPTEDGQTSSAGSEASQRLRGRSASQEASSSWTPLRKKVSQSGHDSDTDDVPVGHASDSELSVRASPTPSSLKTPACHARTQT